MITQDDIDAFTASDRECLRVADEIVGRATTGTTKFRLFRGGQEMQFVRAYVLMRDIAEQAAAIAVDAQKRGLESMSLGDPRRD